MKRNWVTASTMLSTTLLAAPAYAQNVEVIFTGALDYQMAWNTNDQPVAGTGFMVTGVADQSELAWLAQGTSDNGLTYGADIQWRYLSNGAQAGIFDESYLFFSGDWGRVQLGATDDVVDGLATGGHDVQAHSEGFDGEFGNFYTQVGDATFLTTEGSTDDANKIAYYTPNFMGLEGGISFTPQGGLEGQATGTDTATSNNVVETSLAYGAEFDTFAFNASLGYRHADADDNTSGSEVADINAWRAGVKVGFGPVEVGAGYGNNGDSACQQGTSCDAGENFQVGLGYDYGAGRIAVGYAAGWETNNNGTEDDIDVYNISMDYSVAEGLVAYGDLVHARSDNGQAGTANENEGTVLLVGTAVFF